MFYAYQIMLAETGLTPKMDKKLGNLVQNMIETTEFKRVLLVIGYNSKYNRYLDK